MQAFTGATELHGFSIRESAGTPAAAAVILRDGTSATDPPVAHIELVANGSMSERLPLIEIGTGIYVDRVAGETELVLYVS